MTSQRTDFVLLADGTTAAVYLHHENTRGSWYLDHGTGKLYHFFETERGKLCLDEPRRGIEVANRRQGEGL